MNTLRHTTGAERSSGRPTEKITPKLTGDLKMTDHLYVTEALLLIQSLKHLSPADLQHVYAEARKEALCVFTGPQMDHMDRFIQTDTVVGARCFL